MERLGIASGNYRDYLRRRAEGRTPGEIASPRRNDAWALGLVRQGGLEDEHERLMQNLERAKRAREAAANKIIRLPIPKSR